MVDSSTSSSVPVDTSASNNTGFQGAASNQDSVHASFAGILGAGFVVVGLLAFIGTSVATNSSNPTSLGFAAISGIALLSVTLVGLIMLTRAVGVLDATQALGLPNGSIRALLALLLAIVFVAVASWTSSGLSGSLGPLVYQGEVPLAQVDTVKKDYPTDKYIISEIMGDTKATIKIYALRGPIDKDSLDLAKQIVTISATVLVTIVGFYFGSKSASDAVKSANDNLASMQSALSGGPGAQGSNAASPGSASLDDLKVLANAINALAVSTASKVDSIASPPIEAIRKAVTDHGPDDTLADQLATVEASLATVTANARQCADAATQAKGLAGLPASVTQDQIDASYKSLQKLRDSAAQLNHDLEQALASYTSARDSILKATAAG